MSVVNGSDSLKKAVVVAVDAMGGDDAPEVPVKAMNYFVGNFDCSVFFDVYGDQEQIDPFLRKFPRLRNCSKVIHTAEYISGNMKPSVALRSMPKSSMRLAVNALVSKNADVMVSAGNTGALMAISKIFLKMLSGVNRPAICKVLPGLNAHFVMMDLGANSSCSADVLVQFAIMGNAYAKVMLRREKPRVALLNIGTEEIKGRPELMEAYKILSGFDRNVINFVGYIEPREMFIASAHEAVDVVITDGFTGNVAVKASTGSAILIFDLLKKRLNEAGWFRKCLVCGLRPVVKNVLSHLNPTSYNGAVLLGLNGIVIKSHGSADYIGFAHAIKTAFDMADNNVNAIIADGIAESVTDLL